MPCCIAIVSSLSEGLDVSQVSHRTQHHQGWMRLTVSKAWAVTGRFDSSVGSKFEHVQHALRTTNDRGFCCALRRRMVLCLMRTGFRDVISISTFVRTLWLLTLCLLVLRLYCYSSPLSHDQSSQFLLVRLAFRIRITG